MNRPLTHSTTRRRSHFCISCNNNNNKKQGKTKYPAIQDTITEKLRCPHDNLKGGLHKNSIRLVSTNVWLKIRKTFNKASPCIFTTEKCELCQNDKQSDKQAKNKVHEWRSRTLDGNQVLKGLVNSKRRRAGVPSDLRSDVSYVLVDRDAVERWRDIVESSKSGFFGDGGKDCAVFERTIDDYSDVIDCDCEKKGAMVPQRVYDALKGKEVADMFDPVYGQYQDGGGNLDEVKVSRASGNDRSSSLDCRVLICEVITEEELRCLNKSLAAYLKFFRGGFTSDDGSNDEDSEDEGDNDKDSDNDENDDDTYKYSIIPLNKITLRGDPPSSEPSFSQKVCHECMNELHEKKIVARASFQHEVVKVVVVPENHSVPGVEVTKKNDEAAEDPAQSQNSDETTTSTSAEVEILSPRSMRRRSSRQQSSQKVHSIIVDSTDTLATFRLKLVEQAQMFPLGQKIYYAGRELTAIDDSDRKTLESFSVLAGATIYIQTKNMSRGRKHAEFQNMQEACMERLCNSVDSNSKSSGTGQRHFERGFGGSWLTASREEKKQGEDVIDMTVYNEGNISLPTTQKDMVTVDDEEISAAQISTTLKETTPQSSGSPVY